ncbi:MAG: L,D-transpeptidase family protein [Hyphomicrobium sp.]
MRVAKFLAVGIALTVGPVSSAFAVDAGTEAPNGTASETTAPATATQPEAVPDAPPQNPANPTPSSEAQAPQDQAPAQNVVAQPTAPGSPASPSPSPAIVADDHLVYLPVADYLRDNAKKILAGTDADDRQVLTQFYTSRMGSTLWVDRNGLTSGAKNLIAALKDADSWGLRSADFNIADPQQGADGSYNLDDLTAFEARLSLAALEYARDARGGRINDPSSQLGTYIDRKPLVLDRRTVIDSLAAAPDKGAYLASLNPQQEQFRRLRAKLLAMRASAKKADELKIPDGPNLKPGQSAPEIAILRKRLKVTTTPTKKDGTPADDTYYDNSLADAVKAYKESKGIRPATPWITASLRRSLNSSNEVSETKLIANMEEWRWMPANLGDYYIIVNIPEFKFRVVSNGQVIHEERIVSGRPDAQSPIFSETMKTVVIQPRWNVPDSIKIKELLPGLRGGGNPLQRQGLVLEYNGRKVDPYNIDWSRTDIRNFNVYQPPGGGNALGVVKFLFPNKHAVYLHDTPSKSLFNEPVRAFSHGCMRVRNPVTLAELILNKDKGWDAAKVQDLIKNGPEENEVGLDHPIPVHVTYFTAWVADDGQVQSFDDVYGHEKRINLALAGRWNQIVKADEKKVSPEDIPNDGWRNDGLASLFGDDDDDDRDERGRRRHKGGIGNFFKQVFGGF